MTMKDLDRDLDALVRRVRGLGAGPRAELRRLDPRRADTWPAAFWWIYASSIEPHLGRRADDEMVQRCWAALLRGMAMVEGGGPHPGEALAEAGYSEVRFNRLLSAVGERVLDELNSAVRFLAAKRQAVDWQPLARLVLHDPESPAGDGIRRHCAGVYYRTLAKKV